MFTGNNRNLNALANGVAGDVTHFPGATNLAHYSEILPIPNDPLTLDFPSDGRFPLQNYTDVYQELCRSPTQSEIPNVVPLPHAVVEQDHFGPMMSTPPSLDPTMNTMSIQKNLSFEYNGAPYAPGAGGPPPANFSHQVIRNRKKKVQPKKIVEMTPEDLNIESSMWKKYGEKIIKGSPHPRKYYRCTLGKGCSARRQVQQSKTDPNKFLVAYYGEHIHPRLLQRNPLATATKHHRHSAVEGLSSNRPNYGATGNCSIPSTSVEGEMGYSVPVEGYNGYGDEDDEDLFSIPNDLIITNDHEDIS